MSEKAAGVQNVFQFIAAMRQKRLCDMERGMRVAVFDLDGTLADTSADLIAAANAALIAAGHQAMLDPVRDRAEAFAGGRAMLTAGVSRNGARFTEAEMARHYESLLGSYAEAIAVHTRLFDGVERALAALATRGWTLSVCTNKPEALAVALLAELGLSERFAAVLGADTLPWRKPDPRHVLETIRRAGGAPDRAVLIGDTINDAEAARAAGVPCVLVSFGPEGQGVSRLGPDALLEHFDDLPDLLERLAPKDAIGVEAVAGPRL